MFKTCAVQEVKVFDKKSRVFKWAQKNLSSKEIAFDSKWNLLTIEWKWNFLSFKDVNGSFIFNLKTSRRWQFFLDESNLIFPQINISMEILIASPFLFRKTSQEWSPTKERLFIRECFMSRSGFVSFEWTVSFGVIRKNEIHISIKLDPINNLFPISNENATFLCDVPNNK